MKIKILPLLSALLLLPLAARADLHEGDYQLLKVAIPNTITDPFPTLTEVKIIKNKEGEFSIIFPKPPLYAGNADAPKELKIRVAENSIAFSSIVQNGGGLIQCIYAGVNDPKNPDSYKGRITFIDAFGVSNTTTLFVLTPKK